MEKVLSEVRLFDNGDEVAGAAAKFIIEQIRALKDKRRFSLALSGGSTPKITYDKLVSFSDVRELLRSRVDYFFSDERAVGPDDDSSNYKTARVRLFEPLKISDTAVHRLHGETDNLAAETTRYADVIHKKVQVVDSIPAFDITMLGLGPDGHTASLFPDFDFGNVKSEMILAPFVASKDSYRLSFSLKLINASRIVLFLVTGEGKADALAEILMPTSNDLLPAARVQAKSTVWMIDKSAAAKLDPEFMRNFTI